MGFSIKKLRGIEIQWWNIGFNTCDGFSLSIFEFKWEWEGAVCHIVNSASLFCLYLTPKEKDGGRELKLIMGIFFVSAELWSRVITPPKDRCVSCNDLCYTTDYYKDGKPYCNKYCQE